ncbi:hypothetical protein HQ590_09275, partial [bacterium]|nr:hypothetical protein [bacterium]
MKATNDFSIPFTLANPWKFPRHGMPLRCSVPLPRGLVRDPARSLALTDEKGKDVGAQWRVLSRWPDGSVRFALMDYAATVLPPRTTRRYTLQPRAKTAPARHRPGIKVAETRDRLTIDTGRLAWRFSKKQFSLGESIRFNRRDWLKGQASDLCIVDELGLTYRASQGDYRICLEESGPHRVIVRIEGNHGRGEDRFMDYLLRLHFTAGGAQVLMLHHLRNRHGGRQGRSVARCWLAGSLNLGSAACRRILHTSHGLLTMEATIDCPERVDLDTDIWPVEVKPDRYRFPKTDRELAWNGPLTRIRNGASLREREEEICFSVNENNPGKTIAGDRRRCAPLIDLQEPGLGGMLFKFAMANPEAEFPLHLASEQNRFEIDFFPAGDEPHLFGEGMGKTRDVLFNFHDDALDATDRIHESTNLSYPGVVSPGAPAYRTAR